MQTVIESDRRALAVRLFRYLGYERGVKDRAHSLHTRVLIAPQVDSSLKFLSVGRQNHSGRLCQLFVSLHVVASKSSRSPKDHSPSQSQ